MRTPETRDGAQGLAPQAPFSDRIFEHWFILAPWLALVGSLFVFVGLPFAHMAVVWWVKGCDAYFRQGIRFPLGHGLRFSDGSPVPQGTDFLITFAVFMVLVAGSSVLLLRMVKYYEGRAKNQTVQT